MDYPSLPINDVIAAYSGAFDWLHRATARDVNVHVEPLVSGCPNHSGYDFVNEKALNIWNASNPFSSGGATVISSLGISGILNIPFTSGQVCPVCGGEGNVYSPSSGTVSARIQWRTAENRYSFKGEQISLQENADVRIKVTGDAALDLLDRALSVTVDGRECEIKKGHIPVGLRDIHSWYYYLNLKK